MGKFNPKQKTEYISKVVKLEAELRKLEAELRQTKRENEELKQKNKLLQSMSTNLSMRLAESEISCDEWKELHKKSSNEMQETNNLISELNERLAKLSEL